MKKKFIKQLIILSSLMLPMLTWGQRYYIEGNLEPSFVGNELVVKLHNPVGHGIYFTPASTIVGKKGSDGLFAFEFQKVRTDCSSDFRNGLRFEKYEPTTGRFERDVETKAGLAGFRSDKTMLVMIVLDCSSSITDFRGLKDGAISCLSILGKASNYSGNIKVGIIAFNNDIKKKEIVPLTSDNANSLINYIDRLTLADNTKLYEAMDMAMVEMEQYAQRLDDSFDFSTMITFTDGYDNGSYNAKLKIATSDKYLQYLSDRIPSKKIKNKPFESFTIAVKTPDVMQNFQKFYANLKAVSSQNVDEHCYVLNNYAEVAEKFRSIANTLTNRWKNLTCYVPGAFEGRVRWVLDCEEPRPEPVYKPAPVEKDYNGGIGVILGGINGGSLKFYGRHKAFQLDWGFKPYTYYIYDHYNMEDIPDNSMALYVNPNILFGGKIYGPVHWFVGGGLGAGYGLGDDNFLFGVNIATGCELIFRKIPLAVQFDLRPEMLIVDYYTEWGIRPHLSVRYVW